MTFIIKSNAKISNPAAAAGNIHGFYGPDDYSFMLDFTHDIYKYSGDEKAFGDVLTFGRPSPGEAVDILGRVTQYGNGQPRFHAMSSQTESGLLLEDELENYLPSGDDGEAFTTGNSGKAILLSWEGPGSVTLNAAGSTIISTVSEFGRNNVFYTRSGAVTGTISVSGSVDKVMVANSSVAASYVPYGETRDADSLKLAGDALSVIASGTASMVCRVVLLPDDGVTGRSLDMSANNSAAPNGGIRLNVPLARNTLNNGAAWMHEDGSSTNDDTRVARNLGNRSDAVIAGLYFENYGEKCGVICYGQAGQGLASAEGVTPPSDLDSFTLSSAAPGMISISTPIGGIITHCVGYDRMLTDAEAFKLSSFTLR